MTRAEPFISRLHSTRLSAVRRRSVAVAQQSIKDAITGQNAARGREKLCPVRVDDHARAPRRVVPRAATPEKPDFTRSAATVKRAFRVVAFTKSSSS